jgi:hypothetical protein
MKLQMKTKTINEVENKSNLTLAIRILAHRYCHIWIMKQDLENKNDKETYMKSLPDPTNIPYRLLIPDKGIHMGEISTICWLIRFARHFMWPDSLQFLYPLRPYHGQNPPRTTSCWHKLHHSTSQCFSPPRILTQSMESCSNHPPIKTRQTS